MAWNESGGGDKDPWGTRGNKNEDTRYQEVPSHPVLHISLLFFGLVRFFSISALLKI